MNLFHTNKNEEIVSQTQSQNLRLFRNPGVFLDNETVKDGTVLPAAAETEWARKNSERVLKQEFVHTRITPLRDCLLHQTRIQNIES